MQHKLPIFLGIGGLLLILLASIVGWIVAPKLIDSQVKKKISLVEGEETFEQWRDIPVPVYLKFYVFNVTNPDEFLYNGAKPIMQELGPFSYRESRIKTVLRQNEETDTITYNENITYVFDPAHSYIDNDDILVNVFNVPLVAVATLAAKTPPLLAQFANILINNLNRNGEEVVWRNKKVRELIFDGVDVSAYKFLLDVGTGGVLPPEFEDYKFAFYRGKNGTSTGLFEINRGIKDSSKFAQIVKFNGEAYLDYWSGTKGEDDWADDWDIVQFCNKINGSDGSFFPPFIKKDTVLRIFILDVCRSLWLRFLKEIEYEDIPGYRFIIPPDLFEIPDILPSNVCFCPHAGRPLLHFCNVTGVMRIFPCKHGAPIVLSLPHFLDGEDFYLTDVLGLNPTKEEHQTIVDVEPLSGILLRANKRLQINVEVQFLPHIDLFKNFNITLLPIVWADEMVELSEDLTQQLKSQLLTPLKAIDIGKYTVLAIGHLILGIGAAIYIKRRCAK